MKRCIVPAFLALALPFSTVSLAQESAQSPPSMVAEGLRGIVRAKDEAWLSSDLAMPISRLPFREGESFRKGDILVDFDCAPLAAEKKAADARIRVEDVTYRNNKALKAHNATGQFDVDLSAARVDVAKAERDGIAAKLERCLITAPFDGMVNQLAVHAHEVPDRGVRMMQILDSSALEVDVIVPSDWLQWLKQGTAFRLHVDELGTDSTAEIVRIAAAVEAVSQTVKVVGRITGNRANIRPGMSGAVSFDTSQ